MTLSDMTQPNQNTEDTILPFLINNTHLRGRVVRLGSVLNEILTKHAYPEPISHLLGEIIVLVSLLGDTLKCNGLITLQAQTDGIIKLLVADYTAGGGIRGYARINEEHYQQAGKESFTFSELLGKGFLVLTLDQGENTDLYQGIVELQGNSLAECVENYFRQSEQLTTVMRIEVGQVYSETTGMQWRGGGIMAQALPSGKIARETDILAEAAMGFDDQWDKTQAFIESVAIDELIDPFISSDTLLLRLFHEEGVWKYSPQKLTHSCRCSRKKALNILKSLSTEELNSLKVNAEIVVTCQFCSKEEVFTEEMLERGEG